jgi:hypothetical protein
VTIFLCTKAFAEKVSNMADADKNNIAEVSREQDVIRWLLLPVRLERSTGDMLRGMSKSFISAVAELDMASREHLGRVGGDDGHSQDIVLAVAVIAVD